MWRPLLLVALICALLGAAEGFQARRAAAASKLSPQIRFAARSGIANRPAEVIEPDYRLALSTGGASLLLFQAGLIPVAIIHVLLTALLAVQTGRVRFLLDTDSFEVLLNAGDELTKSGENIVVGGENRWKYSTFTNWKFFPSENVPILVYFKETQTKPEGQIHFFPVVCNGQQLLESMTGRNIPRLEES